MSCNHNYLEAVQAGDLSALKLHLAFHPEVDLNYQDAKLQSALHRTVNAIQNSHQMVRVLIAAGIDCSLQDKNALTAVEFAQREGRKDLVLLMLEWEFRDVPAQDVFYQLIRRGSMELSLVYANQNKLSMQQTVQFTEKAYEALRMKGVKLSEQVQYQVEQELVNYYSSNPTFCNIEVSDDDLLENIDFVLENSDEENLIEISDEVLMALRELVKQMYLGKDGRNDAFNEVRYCLCVFLSTYDREKDMALYTLIINKQMVLRFLRLIAKQLQYSGRRLSRRDRKIRYQLRKAFVLSKEVNSVLKVVDYLRTACSLDLNQQNERVINQLVMDRCVQVVGEAIKRTKKSPNLSSRMQSVFGDIAPSHTANIFKSCREFHSHGYPFSKYSLEKEKYFASYMTLQDNFRNLLNIFEWMLLILLTTAMRRFLGSLYSMKTIKQINSLAMFAQLDHIASFLYSISYTDLRYNKERVTELVGDLKALLKKDLKIYTILIHLEEKLKEYFECTSLTNLKHLSFVSGWVDCVRILSKNQCVDSMRLILKYFLAQPAPEYLTDIYSARSREIFAMAESILPNLLQSIVYNMDYMKIVDTVMTLMKQLDTESSFGLNMIQLKEANRASDRYIKEILDECGVKKQTFKQVSKNKLKLLNCNIFTVEKWLQVLKVPDSSEMRTFREKRKDELQFFFEQKVTILNELIFNNSKLTGSEAYSYKLSKNSVIQFAIEKVLLEISEILLGVGKIETNVHLLSLRVPVICGKNLRDGLAHDFLMYDVMSESRNHLICNAIYYANSSIKLYETTDRQEPEQLSPDSCSNLRSKLRWSEMQHKLYDQLKDMQTFENKRVEFGGPDILGCRRGTNAYMTVYCNNALIHAVEHNVELFVAHIDGSKPSQMAEWLIDAIKPPKKPSQLTVQEKTWLLLSVTLKAGDFALCRKITQKYNALLTYEEAFKKNPAVLNHIDDLNLTLSKEMLLDSVKTGNTAAFKKLLKRMDIQTVTDCCALDFAIGHGQLEMAELLVKIVKPREADAELAIMRNFNSVLKQLPLNENNFHSLIKYCIMYDNLEAIKIMKESANIYSNISGLLHTAAFYKRTSILKHFLRIEEFRNQIDELDANQLTPIDICAHRENYAAVRLFLPHTTNIERAVVRACLSNNNRFVKFLLRHNPHLLSKKHIALVNIAIANGNNTMLTYLLDCHTKTKVDLSKQFLNATIYGNIDALDILLKHDPQCAKAVDQSSQLNSFHFAVQSLSSMRKKDFDSNVQKVFDLLIKHKVDPTAKTKNGLTPLHLAIHFGNLNIISRVCKLAPSTIDEPGVGGLTPLISAVALGNLPIVKHLIENNADTSVLSTFRFTILPFEPPITHFLDKNTECLEYVVKTLHVDPNLTDSVDRPLLHNLCCTDNATIMAFLLEKCSADITARDRSGGTVLHCAVFWDCRTVLDYLLERHHCLLDQLDHKGFTPLVHAVILHRRMHIAEKLIMAGASKDILLQTVAWTFRMALIYLKDPQKVNDFLYKLSIVAQNPKEIFRFCPFFSS